MRERRPPEAHEPWGAPARRLGPCPDCGCTVLAAQWVGRQPGSLPVPVGPVTTPVLGLPHDCTVARIQAAAHWTSAVVLMQGWASRRTEER